MFKALGPFLYRRRIWVLAAGALLLLAALASLFRGGSLSGSAIRGLEASAAQQDIDFISRHPADNTFLLLFRSGSLTPGTPAFDGEVDKVLAFLMADHRVDSVAPPTEERTNKEKRTTYALVTLAGDSRTALASFRELRPALPPVPLEVKATGKIPFDSGLSRALEHDLLLAELISLPLALLVLLLVFRTGVAAMLPVAVGGLAVACGIGVVLALSRVFEVSQYTINICSLIGLGVAIDYSLFTVSRYREELAAGRSYADALARAVDHAGRVVAFSALAVCSGLGGLLFFEKSYLQTMGVGGSIVVAFAALFALTVLPALLAVLGPKIHALRMPFLPAPKPKSKDHLGFWHGMAVRVMARPFVVLIPTLLVLLALASPAVQMKVAGSDVRVLPAELEARQGYEALREAFPDEAGSQFLIAVRFPPGAELNADRVGALYDFSERVAHLPGVHTVQSMTYGRGIEKEMWKKLVTNPPPQAVEGMKKARGIFLRDNVILIRALSPVAPESAVARAIVNGIRANRTVADGHVLVGGEAAADIDSTSYLAKRIPRAITFVVLTTMIVLMLLLGSLVLPVKAVLMNFLSVGAAFGALVFIFQMGHLTSQDPRPLEPAIPVLLFCVLFGLSMDYELLMLSRMKEAWERTHDNTLSVGEGLEKSGGLVTSAAAIMVSVFVAFALARVVLIEAVGVGMALAVALDATLVRVLLVPATMRLFGKWNWWEPKWLHAIRNGLGLGHGHGGDVEPMQLPTPEPRPSSR